MSVLRRPSPCVHMSRLDAAAPGHRDVEQHHACTRYQTSDNGSKPVVPARNSLHFQSTSARLVGWLTVVATVASVALSVTHISFQPSVARNRRRGGLRAAPLHIALLFLVDRSRFTKECGDP